MHRHINGEYPLYLFIPDTGLQARHILALCAGACHQTANWQFSSAQRSRAVVNTLVKN